MPSSLPTSGRARQAWPFLLFTMFRLMKSGILWKVLLAWDFWSKHVDAGVDFLGVMAFEKSAMAKSP